MKKITLMLAAAFAAFAMSGFTLGANYEWAGSSGLSNYEWAESLGLSNYEWAGSLGLSNYEWADGTARQDNWEWAAPSADVTGSLASLDG